MCVVFFFFFFFQAEDGIRDGHVTGVQTCALPIWGLVGGCRKSRIAPSTAAAVRDYEALIGTREVVDLLSGFLVVDDRSHGNLEGDVSAFAPGFVGAFAMTSALGLVFRIESEVNQGVVALAGFHDDVAALAAITAGRSAARNELLVAKRKTAIAAIAGLHPNFGFVNEHGSTEPSCAGPPPRRGRLGLR